MTTIKPVISLLLGSGFSIPDGIKGVQELNARLNRIDENEIMIHTSQIALFLNGQEDANRWMNADTRLFVQAFLEFYCSSIIGSADEFHYEDFYDFFSGYLINRENKDVIESFHSAFKEKNPRLHVRDCVNALGDFNRTYNQLIASLIHNAKFYEDVSTSYYPRYESIINFIAEKLKSNDIKAHSLNHDLLFDWFGRSHDQLNGHFSDGFQLAGSPYYGNVIVRQRISDADTIGKTYKVKLSHYVNKHNTPLSLFKLHGSINYKKIYTQRIDEPVVRVKADYGVDSFFYEYIDESGEAQFEQLFDDVSPDYLTGTSTKTLYYKADTHYLKLFEHFKNNLLNSSLLIVIGYGFKDIGINEYLEEYYLSKGKPMIVIDPKIPEAEILKRYSYKHIQRSVIDFSFEELMDICGTLGV